MNDVFEMKPTLRQKIWYHLTCWRPITKYEFLSLQSQLVIILDGMREGDLQHYQIEKSLEQMVYKLQQSGTNESRKREQKNDNDINYN